MAAALLSALLTIAIDWYDNFNSSMNCMPALTITSCSSADFSGSVMQNISTFSKWWILKMPRMSLPCAPASLRKHEEKPAYLIGSSVGCSHSSCYMADSGCSAVAIIYIVRSSLVTFPLASSGFAPLPSIF